VLRKEAYPLMRNGGAERAPDTDLFILTCERFRYPSFKTSNRDCVIVIVIVIYIHIYGENLRTGNWSNLDGEVFDVKQPRRGYCVCVSTVYVTQFTCINEKNITQITCKYKKIWRGLGVKKNKYKRNSWIEQE
jgi:hypothetical protein